MENEEQVLRYLDVHNTLTLCTAQDGLPHGATVFYVNRGFVLYFLSSPDSRHGTDIAGNPRVAATISEDCSAWLNIKGIQLEGMAQPVGTIRDNISLAKTYAKKFPGVKELLFSPSKLDLTVLKKISGVIFYQLTPQRIYFIDNSISFGHREELLLSNGVPRKGPGELKHRRR